MSESFAALSRTPRWVQASAAAIALAGLALAWRMTMTSLDLIGRTFPGFTVAESRGIPPILLPGWSGTSAPGLVMGEITEVDGAKLGRGSDLIAYVAALSPGTSVRYTVRHGQQLREVTVPAQRFSATDWLMAFGAYLLNGLVFLGSGLFAWVLRPRSALTRAVLAFDSTCAVLILVSMGVLWPGGLPDLFLLAWALLPATALQLVLLLPNEHRLAGWRFAGYPASAVLFALLERYHDDHTASFGLFGAIFLLMVIEALFLSLRHAPELWRARSALAVQRARVLGLGVLFGVMVSAIIVLASIAGGGNVGANVAAWTLFLFPLSLTYASVKHNLFEIDAFASRGVYYLVLTGCLGVAYAVAVLVLHLTLQSADPVRSPLLPMLFTLGVLVLFNPLRNRLQRVVDRVFLRTSYDAARVLADFGRALASALRHEEICRLVSNGVATAMATSGTRLFFRHRADGALSEVEGEATVPPALARELGTARIATLDDPPELYADGEVHAAVQAELRALGAEVAVPMLLRGELVGLLAVGAKRSGLFFTAGDAEFLRALAQQAAIALQNASSYEELLELNAELEDRVHERTAELRTTNAELESSNAALEHALAELKEAEVKLVQSAKMASLGRLAAGVAHEINNPVSFIASNLEPLRLRIEKVVGAEPQNAERLLAQARELIEIMAKGAARTVAVVNDLRSFSRLNEAPRKAVDLREGLEVTMRLLETRWRDRIAIQRDYGEVPAVECEAGQINQVFMNVLANACDAIGERGEIHVGLRREGASVVVSIRDTGCGIARENVERIFDPFFTTKEVGAGTGLGLSIAHGIVAAHGGRIEVESTPAAGSTFRVVLPMGSAETALRAAAASR